MCVVVASNAGHAFIMARSMIAGGVCTSSAQGRGQESDPTPAYSPGAPSKQIRASCEGRQSHQQAPHVWFGRRESADFTFELLKLEVLGVFA